LSYQRNPGQRGRGVSGLSMIDALIDDGDIVLMEAVSASTVIGRCLAED
jgi:hypothetical protein